MLAFRTLMHMGEARELSDWVWLTLREMQAIGDLFGVTNLQTGPLTWLRLVQDDAEAADRQLLEAARGLPNTRFTIQSYFHLNGRAQLELYRDEPKEALAWIERQWTALRRSLLLRIGILRLIAWDLRGRVALACAAKLQGTERKQKLGAVEDIAKRLARERYGCSDGFAAQLRSGVLALRGQRQDAARSAEEAHRAFDGTSMKLHAAASHWSQGVLLGDAARVADARAVFEGEEVRCPERFVAMLAPGVLGKRTETT
jgi:hypothetical protein